MKFLFGIYLQNKQARKPAELQHFLDVFVSKDSHFPDVFKKIDY